ncbi:MAG: RHS repeat-associated core domain-containing protein [Armatimonadetes bacterium]|nr:RHS repeat-associated core domain-containing protein [Armatimonadota bacterium]
MSDASQATTVSTIYDAYGNLIASYPNVAPSFGFAGQYRYQSDATGLDYLKARYYNPVTGRFVSPNVIGYEGGLNRFQYANANPTTYADPSGLECTVIATQIVPSISARTEVGRTYGTRWKQTEREALC